VYDRFRLLLSLLRDLRTRGILLQRNVRGAEQRRGASRRRIDLYMINFGRLSC